MAGRAKTEGWIRPETAAKLFAATVSQLGDHVDSKEEFDPNAVPKGMSGADYSSAWSGSRTRRGFVGEYAARFQRPQEVANE